MSGKRRGQTPIPTPQENESETENERERDPPSEASFGEKVRQFSGGSIPKKTPTTVPIKMETKKVLLDIKVKSAKAEIDGLLRAAALQNPVLKDIRVQIKSTRAIIEQCADVRREIQLILIDEKKKSEAEQLQDDQTTLEVEFMEAEELLQPILQPKPKVKKAGDDQQQKDLKIAEAIANSTEIILKDALNFLEAALDAVPLDRSHLDQQREMVEFHYEEFQRNNTIYRDALKAVGKITEFQEASLLAQALHGRRTELIRNARSKLQPHQSHNNGTTVVVDNGRDSHDQQDLPKLADNVKEWNPFWSLFQDVHNDVKLNNTQKFRRLIKATKEGSDARSIVMSYSMSSDNYQSALTHLKKTYGRESLLIKVYVRDLLQMAIDRSMGKNADFRKLVNDITAQMRNLEILGVTEDKCALILYPVIEACLPKHTLQSWQHDPNYSDDLEKIMDFLRSEVDHENERKLAHFDFGEQKAKIDQARKKQGARNQRDGGRGRREERRGGIPSAAAFINGESRGQNNCLFCDNRHRSAECRKALKMPFAEKQAKIRQKGHCFICLEGGHIASKCQEKGKVRCSLCEKSHQKVLCPTLQQQGPPPPLQQRERTEENFVNSSVPQSPAPPPLQQQLQQQPFQHQQQQQQQMSLQPPPSRAGSSTYSYINQIDAVDVPLQLLPVMVQGTTGRQSIIRAMIDSGSQKSYVTESLAFEMRFERVGEETVIHHLFGGGATQPQTHQRVKVYVAGLKEDMACSFIVSVIPTIARAGRIPNLDAWSLAFQERGVKFPSANHNSNSIDMLIGNDVGPRLYTGNIVDLGGGPVAMETRWGWILCGKLPHQHPGLMRRSLNCNITSAFVNLSLSALWDLDLIGIRDEASTKSKEDLAKETDEHFRKNLTRGSDGRYEVKLPFLTGALNSICSNFYAAERRLKGTTANLKTTGYLHQYSALFNQWEADAMIERIDTETESNWKENGHYLPHRAVVKLSSATTPVRPVFDASAKPRGKPSLNMSLDAGPNYLELIPSILTRFRLRKFGVTADIKKAFQQISIAPAHRPYLRFLWWDDPETCQNLRIHQHTRVVFGVSCSPYLLAATLQHHLHTCPPTHQVTAKVLEKSLYVDNTAASLSTVEEVLEFKRQCQDLLLPAQFDLRGWVIGPTGDEKLEPLLGLQWHMKDFMMVDTASAEEKAVSPPTQRNVLALAHSLFDPLGMLSPFILQAKLIMRKCHEEKLGWDKTLPLHLEEQFRKWKMQIPIIKEVQVPRYAFYDDSHASSLHVFSDSSFDAYAAVVFLRCETPEGVKINLIQSKARIATKAMKITVPRLELIGCLIGVRLAATVVRDMEDPDIPVTYYTDSTTALAWIQGDGPWGTFVDNRVREITANTKTWQWRHVRGKNNPADLPSRGCSAQKLLESEWWLGPQWLYQPSKEWPVTNEFVPDQAAVEQEKKKAVAINLAIQVSPHPIQNFLRYSSYAKIIRLTSYWLRYRQILRTRIQNRNQTRINIVRNINNSPMRCSNLEEKERAERVILRYVQQQLDGKNLRKLRPVKDEDGLLRTSTPVMFDDSESFNHPIILPENNEFVIRMLREVHFNNSHIGVQFLLAHIREHYWLINGKRTCRKIVTACQLCRRFNAKRLEVPEPPLPRVRTATGVPFNAIGVDFTGPLFCKTGEKVWIALFTCATYRAIHLEVVDAMSTEEFFIAFRTFANRRGKPKVVISDNGLNFVGASTALQILYQKDVTRFATEEKISWRFLPPNSPWWGGFYERLIGLMKTLMRTVLGKKVVTRKELVGLLAEVEEACNNRPLTYLSESPNDPVPLTPNMMVRNSGLSYFPELDIIDASSAKAAFRRIQRLRESLRSRFRSEYLGALQNRRVNGNYQPLQPGALVLMEKENERRINWPMGVIVDVIMGRDGFPREYLVKTKHGVVHRAAQRLFPLELADSKDEEKESANQIDNHED